MEHRLLKRSNTKLTPYFIKYVYPCRVLFKHGFYIIFSDVFLQSTGVTSNLEYLNMSESIEQATINIFAENMIGALNYSFPLNSVSSGTGIVKNTRTRWLVYFHFTL